MKCNLCPRKCGAERDMGNVGICMSDDKIKIARAALHFWEEPCISGDEGSGAVFFSGCPLKCVYCQNREISRGKAGKEVAAERLEEIFFELKEQKANNINLITPTHFMPQIKKALISAKKNGLDIPVIYNCSGYESIESLREAEEVIDVYLPDFKYFSHKTAKKYSKAEDYPEIAKAAIEEMVRQKSECVFDERGMIKSGVIVRHMMLPGFSEESKKIIEYLHGTYGNNIYMSIMNQYTPFGMEEYPEINRKVSKDEYEDVLDFAVDMGVENAFVQEEGTASESFIPPFDCEGI